MYVLIKFLVKMLLFAGLGFLMGMTKMKKTYKIILIIIGVLVCYIGLDFVMYENWFVSFKTPESAAKYCMETPKYVVTGKKSACVETKDGRFFTYRGKNGWKLTVPGHNVDKKMKWIIKGNDNIMLIKLNATGEVYVRIQSSDAIVNGRKIEIINTIEKLEDNKGTEFYKYTNEEGVDIYSGWLDEATEDYVLTINGDKQYKINLVNALGSKKVIRK